MTFEGFSSAGPRSIPVLSKEARIGQITSAESSGRKEFSLLNIHEPTISA
jgi:hypothetical protein